jgi:hypothetical protein
VNIFSNSVLKNNFFVGSHQDTLASLLSAMALTCILGKVIICGINFNNMKKFKNTLFILATLLFFIRHTEFLNNIAKLSPAQGVSQLIT